MTEKNTYSQHPFLLYFFDKSTEREYKIAHEQGIKEPLKSGITQSIVIWTLSMIMLYFIIPNHFYHILSLAATTVFPLFFIILFTLRRNDSAISFHSLAAVSNVFAGLIIIYICQYLPDGTDITLMILIFTSLGGLYIYKLRYLTGVFASAIYLVTFLFVMTFQEDIDVNHKIILTVITMVTMLFTVSAGYISAKSSRLLFIQNKTISTQKRQIEDEKQESEKLLLNILPEEIANRLKHGEQKIADKHEDVSILFADIVGFTKLSSILPPEELVDILNTIFSRFDQLAKENRLEKIKTIGDAYMVAGGLGNDPKHLEKITYVATQMIHFISSNPKIKQHNLQIRIGIHTGPVIAGVIGIDKFSYDLWGDAVNIASRMESNGEPGKICVSNDVKERLIHHFNFQKRDEIFVKGKGTMYTYFVD